jgi:hypothetical protein
MSSSLNLQPAPGDQGRSFRFLDLPGELRNKIYSIILCSFEPRAPLNMTASFQAPKGVLYLRHNIESQILRTCRLIYNEASYIMAKTNLLVKVTITFPPDEIVPILRFMRCPILPSNQIVLQNLKTFVMSHEIIKRVDDQDLFMTPWTFVLLHRDLDRFCEGLADHLYVIKQHDELVSHIITLVDHSQNGPHTLEPYSQKFLEMLLAPYRDKLRGFPRFTIRGAITDDLAAATMAQVTGPRAEDPELVLSELEELKAKGNDSYGQGDVRMANEHWSRALMKINRLMNGSLGERLREAGGLDFVNRMIALHFDLCSNRAQATIDEMRFFYSDLQSDPELVRSLTERFFNSVVGARDPGNLFILFPGFTWEPSHRKLAKLAYREAVGCRLIGERQFVLQAESAIETAITLLPNDPQLKREKERFSQWKSHVYG